MQLKIRIPKTNITSDKLFTLLVVVMFCHYTLFDYVAVVIGKLPIINVLRPFFFPVLYLFLALLSFKSTRLRWLRISDFGIMLFFGFSILITFLVYPKNAEYIMDAFWTDILPCLPFFLLGLCIDLNEETYKAVGVASCIAILVNVAYVFYFLGAGRTLGGSHGEDYSMYWSYLLLPNTLIAVDYSFTTKKFLPSLCAAVGVIYAFAMGTRGPVVIIAAVIVVGIWRCLKISLIKKILGIALLSGAAVLFVLSPLYMESLVWLKGIISDMGLSTRVVDYMINGEMISQTSGRVDIYKALLEALDAKPVFGYGVFGEYPLGFNAGAHNIYLQLVFNYGYPLGGLLLISYLFVFILAYAKTKESLSRGWLVLFGCWVFIGGMFGGSYLDYHVLFLLGLSLKEIRVAKYRLQEERRANK